MKSFLLAAAASAALAMPALAAPDATRSAPTAPPMQTADTATSPAHATRPMQHTQPAPMPTMREAVPARSFHPVVGL